MRKYILLYVLAIIGIFVQFGFLGVAGNIIFKLLIFSGVSYFLYDIWKATGNRERETLPAPPRETDVRPDSQGDTGRSRTIFEKLSLHTVLEQDNDALRFVLNEFSVIWNLILPNNGYLYLYNGEGSIKLLHKKQLSYIATHDDRQPEMLFNLLDQGKDVLIEKDIQPAANLLPFYKEDEYKPRSLLAIKSTVAEQEYLYFIFDSKTPNAFNSEDIPLLETINGNIVTALGKFLQVNGIAAALAGEKSLLDIANTLNGAQDFEECVEAMSTVLVNRFEASKLTIAFIEERGGNAATAVIKKAVGIDDPFKKGYEFSLEDGLNGWVISKNKPYLIDNIDKGEYFIPRFTKEEKTNYDIKSFLSVPIQLNGNAVGLITLEDITVNKYSEADKNQLQDFSRIFSYAVKRFLKINTKNGG